MKRRKQAPPTRCLVCAFTPDFLICPDCQASIVAPPPVCEEDSPLAERRATAVFKQNMGIQDAIRLLKYEGCREAALPLAARLCAVLMLSGWTPDLVTAVPLHRNRLKQRGYNQAALLAEPVARYFDLPFKPNALRKVIDVKSQIHLNAAARQKNIANAFRADPRLVRGRKVVIIDDMCTTGATLTECAQVLCEAGAATVWGLSAAAGYPQRSRGLPAPVYCRLDVPVLQPARRTLIQWFADLLRG
jgi:ComF family protein